MVHGSAAGITLMVFRCVVFPCTNLVLVLDVDFGHLISWQQSWRNP
jgi:hypothetical protein